MATRRGSIPIARLLACTASLAGLGGCSASPEERCTELGRSGGVMYSADNVLAIAVQPEALDETTEFCIVRSEHAPAIYGEAYRVFPNPPLHFAAAISYRHALPDDVDEVNIGRIDPADYAEGRGQWESLPGCRIEQAARQVSCTDDEIAKFYGLLDDFEGSVSDSIADTGTGDGPGTDPTSAATTLTTATTPVTDTNDTNDTNDTDDTDDTGPAIDYPPECDSLARGPFDVIEVGQIFDPDNLSPPGGAEDIAPDGQGGFIGRSDNILIRLDVTNAAYGVDLDPGFEVTPLVAPEFPTTSTLGLRYRSNGDLVMMQAHTEEVEILHTDGSLDLVTALGLPNGLYVDIDDVLWLTDYTNGEIIRFDVARRADTVVAEVPLPNGILYDPLRSTVFFVNRVGGAGTLFRQRVSAAGDPQGATVEVTTLAGNPDGISIDVCGNVYVVDQEDARIDRVFMDDDGDELNVEEIVADVGADVSNAVFATGPAYGDFETSMFITGTEGRVFYVDVFVHGAPVPVLDMAPMVDDSTTGG